MSVFASEHREEMPKFTKFSSHLDNVFAELTRDYPESRKFLELLRSIPSLEIALVVFGSYRSWGHPYIDYHTGLTELKQRLLEEKEVDTLFANKLASDLAKKILLDVLRKDKVWGLDSNLLDPANPLYPAVQEGRYPTDAEIRAVGDTWNLLPIIKVWEIPELIPLEEMYSDSSHSVNRTELLQCIRDGRSPTKKVLETFKDRPCTNIKEFLERVNREGLSLEALVIGLRDKEREVKFKGRYFAMMSWELREYIVATEYLTKIFVLPLFNSITMSDSSSDLTKKLLDITKAQGVDGYEELAIANHIDYAKWCNSQRRDANDPVFRVVGQALGLPELFTRTHEFLEKSWIYYVRCIDELIIENDKPTTKNPESPYFFEGIKGGLEGLRQKLWCVVSLLALEHSGSIRSTRLRFLAQGDNQVIITYYRLWNWWNKSTRKLNLLNVFENNNAIMDEVSFNVNRLGLTLNQDETVQSADLLIYGKSPVIRGVIYGLEQKRWARITGMSNDQLPTLANLISSVGSNALTVSQGSDSPVHAICYYYLMGNFVLKLACLYNYVLKRSIKTTNKIESETFVISSLYLDPSLGGSCGVSLSRFLMRSFPDKVTESLAFWKFLADCLGRIPKPDQEKINLCWKMANPEIGSPNEQAFARLLEDPICLNIPGALSAKTFLQEEVKRALLRSQQSIRNELLKEGLAYMQANESNFINWLAIISPCFPRFLSSLYSATFNGKITSIVSLVQKSRTYTSIFKESFSESIDRIVNRSETLSIMSLCNITNRNPIRFSCSRKRADELRSKSYGCQIIGSTQPHPLEILSVGSILSSVCAECNTMGIHKNLISVNFPKGFSKIPWSKGSCQPYLGSRTAESTSLVQSWEKKTVLHPVKRAHNLVDLIGWICREDGALAETILNNFKSMTSIDLSSDVMSRKRSGVYEHRMFSDRVEAGGYINSNIKHATFMHISSDRFRSFEFEDGNFMYQPLMLYAQMVTGTQLPSAVPGLSVHYHIACDSCIQSIHGELLEAPRPFSFEDTEPILSKFKPEGIPWIQTKPRLKNLQTPTSWTTLTDFEKSESIGSAQGFSFGISVLDKSNSAKDIKVFPLTIKDKLIPKDWFYGILRGILLSACLESCFIRGNIRYRSGVELLQSIALDIISKMVKDPGFGGLAKSNSISREIMSIPYSIPKSYPVSDLESRQISKIYLVFKLKEVIKEINKYIPQVSIIWFFSDLWNNFFTLHMAGAIKASSVILKRDSVNVRAVLAEVRDLVRRVRNGNETVEDVSTVNHLILYHKEEIRSACRSIKPPIVTQLPEGPQLILCPMTELVNFRPSYTGASDRTLLSTQFDKRPVSPLVHPARPYQIPTSGYVKIAQYMETTGYSPTDILVGGDGSGGMLGYLLNRFPSSLGIFNSTLNTDNISLKGLEPTPPSALTAYGINVHSRCVNYNNCWEHSNDLTKRETWEYVESLVSLNNLRIDLLVFDFQKLEPSDYRKFVEHLYKFLNKPGQRPAVVLVKDYISSLVGSEGSILGEFSRYFKSARVIWGEMTGAHSSEFYWELVGYPDSKLNTEVMLDKQSFILSCKSLNHPWFNTDMEEIERAKRLIEKRPAFCIPKKLDLPFKLLYYQFFDSMGLENHAICRIIEVMQFQDQSYRLEKWLAAIIYGGYKIFNSQRLFIHESPVPSDGQVEKLTILYLGFHFYYTLLTKSSALYQRCCSGVEQGVGFYLIKEYCSIGGVVKWRTRWSTREQSRNIKQVNILRKRSTLNQLLRLTYRYLYPCKMGFIDWGALNRELSSLKDNLSLSVVLDTSGWFDYVESLRFGCPSEVPEFDGVEEVSDSEGAYFD